MAVKPNNIFVDSILYVVVGVTIGSVMAFAAGSFLWAAASINTFSKTVETFIDGELPRLVPAFFLLGSAGLILILRRALGIKRFHSPRETIAAVQSEKPLDIKGGLGSTLAALIAVGGGASVGQYGPLVHFGGTVGAAVAKAVKTRIPGETWIGCGVAGAIAAGFGVPLAAIVFSHEVVLRRFSISAIAPISICAITAAMLSDQFQVGGRPYFDGLVHSLTMEFIPLLILSAPVFAITAVLFMALLGKLTDKVDQLPNLPAWPLIVAALLCALVGLWVPGALGLGIDVVQDFLSNSLPVAAVLILIAAKLVLTVACVGAGLHGGIYLPSLFIGAGVGCLLGKVAATLGIASGAGLSIAGMAAVAAAVFGAPISTVLIIFEFTRSYEAALVSIIAVTICTLISHQLYAPSFFDRDTG
ncbi:MAG: chloride channel protein [Pseudomonadota bacterium]|nr:chloride channel protein [Pseudomonadota bacterium]